MRGCFPEGTYRPGAGPVLPKPFAAKVPAGQLHGALHCTHQNNDRHLREPLLAGMAVISLRQGLMAALTAFASYGMGAARTMGRLPAAAHFGLLLGIFWENPKRF